MRHSGKTAAGLVALVSMLVSGAEVTIDNQVVGDGHLNITTDDFGAFAAAFAGGFAWLDLFDPSADPKQGPLDEEFPTFGTNLFLFTGPSGCGEGLQRVALALHEGIASTYQGNLDTEIIEANKLVDPQTTASAFVVSGGGVDLRFDLIQHVDSDPTGPGGEAVAFIEQTYAITNQGPITLNFVLIKHIDPDMKWSGGPSTWLDDIVGVDFFEFDRPQVFGQDAELLPAAFVLRTREDMTLNPATQTFSYYAGKQGVTPPGNPAFPCDDCPMYDYGTDFQIWNNYGVPNCWRNFVPGAGYNVPGAVPPLSGDTLMGLQLEVSLASGAVYEVTFVTRYGFRPVIPDCLPPVLRLFPQSLDEKSGCGEFVWSLKNVNPNIPGQGARDIETFYIDIEAGSGGKVCAEFDPPAGWNVTLCEGFDENGHALYRFTDGPPIPSGQKLFGRLTIDTNGLSPTTNPETDITVPVLSIIAHAAQHADATGCNADEAACDFSFGPRTSGDWSLPAESAIFLPVPAMDLTTRMLLLLLLTITGTTVVILNQKKNGADSRCSEVL